MNTKRIWIVSTYDGIEAIFSTEAKADEYIARKLDRLGERNCDDTFLESYAVDDEERAAKYNRGEHEKLVWVVRGHGSMIPRIFDTHAEALKCYDDIGSRLGGLAPLILDGGWKVERWEIDTKKPLTDTVEGIKSRHGVNIDDSDLAAIINHWHREAK